MQPASWLWLCPAAIERLECVTNVKWLSGCCGSKYIMFSGEGIRMFGILVFFFFFVKAKFDVRALETSGPYLFQADPSNALFNHGGNSTG